MSSPNRRTRRARRALSVGAAALLALGLAPGVAGAARNTDSTCPSTIPEDGYGDTGPEGTALEEAVDCLVAYAITSGKTSTTYDSGALVSRGQLATFVLNTLDLVDGFDRPASAPDAFADDDGTTHEDNIDDAAALDIIGGFPDGTFRPNGSVTRGQMATFLVNALDAAGADLPTGAPDAFDDDDGTTHEDNIDILASDEIDVVDGNTAGDYDEGGLVQRQTMAFFLTRTLDVLVDQGLATPLADDNQSLDVAPTSSATIEYVAVPEGETSDDDTSDDRAYTVDDLTAGQAYRITLVDADNITIADDGTVRFQEDGDTGLAAAGTVAADITVVNGAPANTGTSNGQSAGGVTPVGGRITFTVDGNATESIVPVVYTDQGGANTRLNVDDDGEPTEPFGLGGQIDYIPAEAGSGPFTGEVVFVDEEADFFVIDEERFEYDGTDDYFEGLTSISMAAFEAALSTGDTVQGSYADDPDADSSFSLTDDNPGAPTGVIAEQAGDDARVSWTAPEGDVDSYEVLRATASTTDVTNGDCETTTDGSYTVVGTSTSTAFTDGTVVVPEEYCYRVVAVNDGDDGEPSDPDFVALTPDATRPTSVDARVDENEGLTNSLDEGDVVKVVFDETMADPADGSRIRVQDGDGTVAELVCDTPPVPVTPAENSECELNTTPETVGTTGYPAGRVLTVTVGTTPEPLTAGSSPGLQYPVTVIDSAGITDAAGNAWNIAPSADKVIDSE